MKGKTPNIVAISILTVITLFTWIVYEVYQTLVTPPPLEVDQAVLAPITPTLNSESLDKLQQSVFFEDEEISSIVIPVTTPTLLPTPTPETTPAEELTATPEEETPTGSPTPTAAVEEEEEL